MTATSHLLGGLARTGPGLRRVQVPRLVEDGEAFGERTERSAAVRAGVLLGRGELGEGAAVAGVGDEHRVVAEPAAAATLAGDRPLRAADRGELPAVGEAGDRDR